MNTGLLFNELSILDVKRTQEEELALRVRGLADDAIRQAPQDLLAADLFEEFRLDAPVLQFDRQAIEKHAGTLDVSRDPMRVIRDRRVPFNVECVVWRLLVPIVGDPKFFHFQPSSFTLNPPQGRLQDDRLVFSVKQTEPDPEALKREFDRWRADVDRNLGVLDQDCKSFNMSLPGLVDDALRKRYAKLEREDRVIAELGIPIAKPTATVPAETPKRRADESFDAFICHASEDKAAIAGPLARALVNKGVRIWFDEFELTVGDSLRRSIDKGLTRSRYGIVIISQTFLGKRWTEYELDGLVALETSGKRDKVILPIWHGISKNEVAAYSPTLADKVALDADMGIPQLVAKLLPVLRSVE